MSDNDSIKKDAISLINAVKVAGFIALIFGVGESYIDTFLYYIYEADGFFPKVLRYAVISLFWFIALDTLIAFSNPEPDKTEDN